MDDLATEGKVIQDAAAEACARISDIAVAPSTLTHADVQVSQETELGLR